MPQLTSPINKALVLRGVVPAMFPILLGKVLHEREERVRLRVAGSPEVAVRTRVVRSNAGSLLHFEYQLAMLESDYDDSLRMSIEFFGSDTKVTFADFRVDGPGKMPPNYFESSEKELAAFRFDYGLAVGRDSRLCVIATNAREFKETGGTVKLITKNTQVAVDVPMPAGSGVSRPLPVRVEESRVEGE